MLYTAFTFNGFSHTLKDIMPWTIYMAVLSLGVEIAAALYRYVDILCNWYCSECMLCGGCQLRCFTNWFCCCLNDHECINDTIQLMVLLFFNFWQNNGG